MKVWVSSGPEIEEGTLPDVVGKQLQVAYDILNSLNFKNIVIEPVESDAEKDTVIGQSEMAGTKIDVTTVIILEVSTGPKVEIMPDLSGKTFEEAKKLLNDLGFMDVEPEYVESIKTKDTVVEQSVKPEDEVKILTSIVLKVSKGYPMPDLAGKTVEDAKKLLGELGITNIKEEPVFSDQDVGTVVKQSVAKDTLFDESTGIEIVLEVSCGPQPVKKKLIIDFSGLELAADCEFVLQEDDELYPPMVINGETKKVEIDVEGYGEVTYQIFVDGISVKTVKVDFSDGQPTVQIMVS